MLAVIVGVGCIPFAARMMASEETIECPGCDGTGETTEGRAEFVDGYHVYTYRYLKCGGEGTVSNGQLTAGAGCGGMCLAFIGLGVSTGYMLLFGEPPAPPPTKNPPAHVADETNRPKKQPQSPPAGESQPPAPPANSGGPHPKPPAPADNPRPASPTPTNPEQPRGPEPAGNPRLRTWQSADG